MGASRSNSGKPMEFYTLKAKVDEQNKPFFAKLEKVNDVWTDTGTFDTIEGMLNGAKIEEKDLKEYGKKKFFVLFLEDENGVCKVDMSHNAVTYSIINSLSSCADKMGKFTINVYRAKPEVKDGKTYHNGRASVKKDGQKTEWFVKPQDTPKKVPVMVGDEPFMKDGKQVFDDTKVRKYWETIFETAIVGKIGSSNREPAPEAAPPDTNAISGNKHGDDLPF